jgi:hypothetical protein
MPVSFGAITFSLTAPSGFLQESSQETAVELATIKDATGQTALVQPKPRSTTTTTLKTKGEDDLLTVPQGSFAGAKLTSSKVSQTNDDFSTSEATYTLFE